MDAKQLEHTLRTIDFSNRFEDKLKTYMDNELVSVIVNRSQGPEETKPGLLEVITVFHEYYKKVLMLFFPLIKSDRTEESRDPKLKRKLEFKDKLLTDFKQAFLNHLKFSVLDRINYSDLFEEFITVQYPIWQRQIDQGGLDMNLTDSENLDFIRRLLQQEGILPDMEIENENNQIAFDAGVNLV